MHTHGWIDTKEGGHIVCPGDFIITGIAGERYPCKPAIFAATYEAVLPEKIKVMLISKEDGLCDDDVDTVNSRIVEAYHHGLRSQR